MPGLVGESAKRFAANIGEGVTGSAHMAWPVKARVTTHGV